MHTQRLICECARTPHLNYWKKNGCMFFTRQIQLLLLFIAVACIRDSRSNFSYVLFLNLHFLHIFLFLLNSTAFLCHSSYGRYAYAGMNVACAIALSVTTASGFIETSGRKRKMIEMKIFSCLYFILIQLRVCVRGPIRRLQLT